MTSISIVLLDLAMLLSLFIAIYPLFIFPLLLMIIRKFKEKQTIDRKTFTPEISILISAYNEQDLIEDCINSILSSDYPQEKITIFVGSDGSDDNTFKILQELSSKYNNLQVFEFNRIGKNFVLNCLIDYVKTDFVGFIDADCRYQKNSLNVMMENLADSKVGGAMLPLSIQTQGSTEQDNSELMYQKYENFLRKAETQIYTNINPLGIMCIRKECFTPIANKEVCDDTFTSYSILSSRKLFVFDDRSNIIEIRDKSIGNEFNRRVRIAAGGLSTLKQFTNLLHPKYGWASFFVWSHKVFRLLQANFVLLSLVLAVTSYFIFDSTIAYLYLGLAIVVLLLSFIFWISTLIQKPIKILKMFYWAVVFNYTLLIGFVRFIGKQQNSIWAKNG